MSGILCCPKERHRVKKLLAQEESLFPGMFGNMRNAMIPLMDAEYMRWLRAAERVHKNAGTKKGSRSSRTTKGK